MTYSCMILLFRIIIIIKVNSYQYHFITIIITIQFYYKVLITIITMNNIISIIITELPMYIVKLYVLDNSFKIKPQPETLHFENFC